MAFMALTNCFRRNFLDFLKFAFICQFLQPKDLVSPTEDPGHFPEVIMNLDNSFYLMLSNVCYDFEDICLKKISLIF